MDLSSCVLCARLHVCCVACVLGFALNLSSAGARGRVAPAGPSLRVHQSQDFPVRIVTRPSATSGLGIEECLCGGTLGPEQGKGVVADLWGFVFVSPFFFLLLFRCASSSLLVFLACVLCGIVCLPLLGCLFVRLLLRMCSDWDSWGVCSFVMCSDWDGSPLCVLPCSPCRHLIKSLPCLPHARSLLVTLRRGW